jgi:hypothetical protein
MKENFAAMKALRTGIYSAFFLLALGINLHASPTLNCGTAVGTKFNLEPATNAVPQLWQTVDFIPNRISTNVDLVVAGALDYRGTSVSPPPAGFAGRRSVAAPPPSGAPWDGSMSGYYVGQASAAGCQPVFEGGLPTSNSGGNAFGSIGGIQIGADPARDAFFAADVRLSSNSQLWAIGLFRASSATLLNPALCPRGTHTEAQAQSCWEATAPAVIDPVNGGGIISPLWDTPSMAVDERSSGAGTGAGDVYVAVQSFDNTNAPILLFACTNSTLSCSSPVTVSNAAVGPLGNGNAYVQVRPDGKITVTYVNANTNPQLLDAVQFAICTPHGAPNPPTCGAPTLIANEMQPIGAVNTLDANSLSGSTQLVFSSVRHADRLEADGKTVTTFAVWDRCKSYFMTPPPGTYDICLDADVVMSTSTDGGNTWSPATAVNTNAGHQFMPWISTDDSTGTVNIVYYDTEADPFHKQLAVSLNQIAPGTATVGPALKVTTAGTPWDANPNQTSLPLEGFDFHLGMKSRGMGTTGHSRIYASFTSTGDRRGVYAGAPLPEQNNNLQLVLY